MTLKPGMKVRLHSIDELKEKYPGIVGDNGIYMCHKDWSNDISGEMFSYFGQYVSIKELIHYRAGRSIEEYQIFESEHNYCIEWFNIPYLNTPLYKVLRGQETEG